MVENLSTDIFPGSSLILGSVTFVDSDICLRVGCLLLPTPKDPAPLLFFHSAPSKFSCRPNSKSYWFDLKYER